MIACAHIYREYSAKLAEWFRSAQFIVSSIFQNSWSNGKKAFNMPRQKSQLKFQLKGIHLKLHDCYISWKTEFYKTKRIARLKTEEFRELLYLVSCPGWSAGNSSHPSELQEKSRLMLETC